MKQAMLLLLGLFASTVACADDKVYMLGKLKVQDSTYAMLVFFQDPAVNTIAACEKEVMFGRNGQWQYYGHQVKKAAGISLTMDYFCRSSSLPFSAWQPKDRYDYIYLVDVRNEGLTLKEFDTYAACVGHMKQQKQTETYDHFCSKANQTFAAPATH